MKVNADQRHRRMGPMNGKKLGLLNETDASSVSFSSELSLCNVCPVGNIIHQPRVTMPFQLVYDNLVDPISPPAMGGF